MNTDIARAVDAAGRPLDLIAGDKVVAHILGQVEWARSVGRAVTVTYGGDNEPITVDFQGRRVILSPRNWIYVYGIVRKFDYYFSPLEPPVIDGIPTADFSRPAWHKLNGFAEPYYFTCFTESFEECELYRSYLQPKRGEVVLDLGSYCGVSAMMFAKAVGPEGRVVALEPDPENFVGMKINLDAYGDANITALNEAVWSTPKTLLFSCEGNMGSMVVTRPEDARDRLIEVKATTLEDIARDHQIPKVDVIKMDIEGSEYEVLESAADFINTHRSRWMIDVHNESPGGSVNLDRIRAVFDAAGYSTVEALRNVEGGFPMIWAQP